MGKDHKEWTEHDYEERFLREDRKAGKQERKLASSKDRSKYKKTDREKFQLSPELHKNIKLSKEELLKGRVLSITPQGFVVAYEGKTIVCSLRGLLKKDKSQMKNLVTVGDFVLFEKSSEDEGLIAHVEPRRTLLSRADNLSRRKEQLIAANIDLALITASVVSPPLKPSLVDRYIIAAIKGGLEPVIIVNKIDLLKDKTIDPILLEEENQLYHDFLEAYALAKIPVIPVSIVTNEGLDALREVMKDKASVFSGQSGVGKSSLINAITGLDLRVGKIVDRTQKGSHTTTTTNLLPLEFGGWCIDTPGIKSFGVWDLKKDKVENYFHEIHEHAKYCKFPNCIHLHEEDCAVIKALHEGKISLLRYQSYQLLMDSISQEHYRR